MNGTKDHLSRLLETAGLSSLQPQQAAIFEKYLQLILRWNARINLSAIRNEEEILSRHFVESIACARALPGGIKTLLDFGSGAGFPGIPIAISRPEIAVTLAESQGKKAAFLQEAVRVLNVSAVVHSARAQTIENQFDCVILRAVDKMEDAVAEAAHFVCTGGWLALMTTGPDLPALRQAAGSAYSWSTPILLPASEQRMLVLGHSSKVAAFIPTSGPIGNLH